MYKALRKWMTLPFLPAKPLFQLQGFCAPFGLGVGGGGGAVVRVFLVLPPLNITNRIQGKFSNSRNKFSFYSSTNGPSSQ